MNKFEVHCREIALALLQKVDERLCKRGVQFPLDKTKTLFFTRMRTGGEVKNLALETQEWERVTFEVMV